VVRVLAIRRKRAVRLLDVFDARGVVRPRAAK
jgi:hypothetical protein